MDSDILFSNNCPKCRILKQALNSKGYWFKESDDFDELSKEGFMGLPVYKTVSGEYKTFEEMMIMLN